jgi:hypothetical protein
LETRSQYCARDPYVTSVCAPPGSSSTVRSSLVVVVKVSKKVLAKTSGLLRMLRSKSSDFTSEKSTPSRSASVGLSLTSSFLCTHNRRS